MSDLYCMQLQRSAVAMTQMLAKRHHQPHLTRCQHEEWILLQDLARGRARRANRKTQTRVITSGTNYATCWVTMLFSQAGEDTPASVG